MFDLEKALEVVVREAATALLLMPGKPPYLLHQQRLRALASPALTQDSLRTIANTVAPPPLTPRVSAHRRYASADAYEARCGGAFRVSAVLGGPDEIDVLLLHLIPGSGESMAPTPE